MRVGAGVGVGVGVPLLLGLGAFLFLWLRERRISQHLRNDLDACGNPYHPIIPSAWRKNGELGGGEESGNHYVPTERNIRYAQGQQELEGASGLQQLPADGQDVNQELPTRSMRE